jgi:TM2 domain-containing membrane protein YozV
VFGFVGVQHFYLGRYVEGLIDVWLTVAWVYAFVVAGDLLLGAIALGADLTHSFVVTIMLLTGNFKDGEGKFICYPGQELR